ncbi:hypothetical protein [Burkholderia territorii]|uniref:hypothetical protein n=1 Tax=Burkholderia territorii TaxID=1503055 RepID=UPI00075AEF10|nr:hypothetical protein [Burkholderia territorii]KWA08738.1 hypothetical protein WT37_24660 [Burkholderia territorii]
MPFHLYSHYGKHKVSFGYKLSNGRWAFRLSAHARQKDAIAKIRKQVIERTETLNGDADWLRMFEALADANFDWQENLPHPTNAKAQITLAENHVYGYRDKRAQMGAPAKGK